MRRAVSPACPSWMDRLTAVPLAIRNALMFDTFRDGVRLVRGRSILLILLGVSAVFGLYSEGLDRLWTKHLLDNFTLPGGIKSDP